MSRLWAWILHAASHQVFLQVFCVECQLFLFCCSKHVCIASFTCNLAPPPALQFSSEFITEIDIKRTDSRGLTLGSSLPPFITPSIQITVQSCSSQITEWWGNKRWDWSKALDDYGPDPVTSLQCPDAVSPPAALFGELLPLQLSQEWLKHWVFVSDHFLSRVRCTSPVLCVAETVFYVLLLFRRESTSKVFYYICLIEEHSTERLPEPTFPLEHLVSSLPIL